MPREAKSALVPAAAQHLTLPPDIWEAIVACLWRSIAEGTDSVCNSLPSVAALACLCMLNTKAPGVHVPIVDGLDGAWKVVSAQLS